MHTNSRLLFQKRARGFFRPGVRVFEIGPDKFPSTYCSLIATVLSRGTPWIFGRTLGLPIPLALSILSRPRATHMTLSCLDR